MSDRCPGSNDHRTKHEASAIGPIGQILGLAHPQIAPAPLVWTGHEPCWRCEAAPGGPTASACANRATGGWRHDALLRGARLLAASVPRDAGRPGSSLLARWLRSARNRAAGSLLRSLRPAARGGAVTDPLAPVLDSLARYEQQSCPAELAAVDQVEAEIQHRWATKGWTLDEGAARAVLVSIASQPLYTLDHLRTAAAFARHITRTDVSS